MPVNAAVEALVAAPARFKAAERQPAPVDRPERMPRPLDFTALAQHKAPDRHWFRPDWLGTGTTVFPGFGGSGKSGVVQHEATAGALGRPYFAPAAAPYRSLVWNCEDEHDDMWRRQERICEHEDLSMGELPDKLQLVSRYGCDNALMAEVQRSLITTSLFEELREQVNDLNVDVLWLDNAAHVFAGNHDDRTQVTQFINLLNGLVRGRPFGVVIVAHVSRAQGSEFSGSVAWENAARMRWYLGSRLPDQPQFEDGADTDPNARFLAKRKSNYSARDHVRMTMHNGLLIPDQIAPTSTGGLVSMLDERRADEVCLAGFHTLRGMGLLPTDAKSAADYLPKQLAAKKLMAGYGKNDMERAMHRLMSSGTFIRGEVSKYSNRTPRLGLILKETTP